jgi:hypothetical protein
MTPKARHPVSCIALAVIWQLVTLIPSTHAQTELHSTSSSTSTSNNPSDACTRALKTDGSTGAPVAHFPCLSFAPLSTTTAEAASPLSFSLSAQETPSVLSSSVTVPQSFNSTSPHAVSKSTVYTTLRSNDPATSTSAPKQVHTDQWDTLIKRSCERGSFSELDDKLQILGVNYDIYTRRQWCYQRYDVPSDVADGNIHYDELSFGWPGLIEDEGFAVLWIGSKNCA